MSEVVVIGAGPAGVMAALRAAELGARTTLVTSGRFGGMAAQDGPVPVRTLAHAARLMRDARQFADYGVTVGKPVLDYPRLLQRVAAVVREVGDKSALRVQVGAAGVAVLEDQGPARFTGGHTIATAAGLRIHADKVIICTGGVSRRLDIPGFELTHTHSDAWSLAGPPASLLVVGSGATGAQVASVFNAFGTRVQLFEAGDRILRTEEPEVAACVAGAYRACGIAATYIQEGQRFGLVDVTKTGLALAKALDHQVYSPSSPAKGAYVFNEPNAYYAGDPTIYRGPGMSRNMAAWDLLNAAAMISGISAGGEARGAPGRAH